MNRIKVLIADDHRIVADGLRNILESEYDLVGIAEDGRTLVDLAIKLEPDVIVADISMPSLNGLDAMEILQKLNTRAKFIFLTMHKDVTYAAKAIRLGAVGYVLKHSASEELLRALELVLGGGKFISPEIADGLQNADQQISELEDHKMLTTRQREVLQLFAEGKSAKEVAATLGISARTAENHKARIMTQLRLRSTSELVQYAIRHGLIASP
ncbi:MAG: response regulator transcription factor [Planctomycetota bacterium]